MKLEFIDRIKERMEYGWKNEINVVVMFVGKVLFCFYLLYIFLEEGCVKYMLDEVYVIVSLDGSCINLVMC